MKITFGWSKKKKKIVTIIKLQMTEDEHDWSIKDLGQWCQVWHMLSLSCVTAEQDIPPIPSYWISSNSIPKQVLKAAILLFFDSTGDWTSCVLGNHSITEPQFKFWKFSRLLLVSTIKQNSFLNIPYIFQNLRITELLLHHGWAVELSFTKLDEVILRNFYKALILWIPEKQQFLYSWSLSALNNEAVPVQPQPHFLSVQTLIDSSNIFRGFPVIHTVCLT